MSEHIKTSSGRSLWGSKAGVLRSSTSLVRVSSDISISDLDRLPWVLCTQGMKNRYVQKLDARSVIGVCIQPVEELCEAVIYDNEPSTSAMYVHIPCSSLVWLAISFCSWIISYPAPTGTALVPYCQSQPSDVDTPSSRVRVYDHFPEQETSGRCVGVGVRAAGVETER